MGGACNKNFRKSPEDYPRRINKTQPNWGNRRPVTIKPGDDARNVHFTLVESIVRGLVIMPFRHSEALRRWYEQHDPSSRFCLMLKHVDWFAQYRNHRVMKKANEIRKHNGKPLFSSTLWERDEETLPAQISIAKELGIDPSGYLDEVPDKDDVLQCTNEWCYSQTEKKTAVDNIVIIRDVDGDDWLVTITRQFGPGRSQKAFAGGFVEAGETVRDAGLREREEETSFKSSIPLKSETVFEPRFYHDWDPRFTQGIEVGAVAHFYDFRDPKKG